MHDDLYIECSRTDLVTDKVGLNNHVVHCREVQLRVENTLALLYRIGKEVGKSILTVIYCVFYMKVIPPIYTVNYVLFRASVLLFGIRFMHINCHIVRRHKSYELKSFKVFNLKTHL